jgi:hypothetical protein
MTNREMIESLEIVLREVRDRVDFERPVPLGLRVELEVVLLKARVYFLEHPE